MALLCCLGGRIFLMLISLITSEYLKNKNYIKLFPFSIKKMDEAGITYGIWRKYAASTSEVNPVSLAKD